VANADRVLPFADASFTLILSITARLNAAEFRRLLRPDGRVLIALAGPDDLRELRGGSAGRDRVARTVEAFAKEGFTLGKQHSVTTVAAMDAASIVDLRHAIYMPPGACDAAATGVESMTFSLDLLRFHRSN
jgi:23S rRNA (guanine745-N1)-methyltransferase